MALSDLAIRQTKATNKTFTLADFDGLCLHVSPQGGKSWHFRYYWAGKQKRMSFGTYPEVGLREARHLRDEARGLLTLNPASDLDMVAAPSPPVVNNPFLRLTELPKLLHELRTYNQYVTVTNKAFHFAFVVAFARTTKSIGK